MSADLRGAREVFRDAFLLVLDKPSGLAVQGEHGENDLFAAVRAAYPGAALHHRLDQPASGLLVMALHDRANPGLARAFREGTAHREYRAVCAGGALPGRWSWPLEGKKAVTEVEILGEGSGFTALGLRLQTGRTHQIRQHAAMNGTPLAGDQRYGGPAGRAWPRLALHAWRLALAHPVTGEPLAFEAPIPADLARLWALAGGPLGGAVREG